MKEENKLWFKRKTYGWGWVPVTWQGYVITLSYIGLVLVLALTIDNESSRREIFFAFILPALLLTITLFRILFKKGEKPRWQWGDK